jgi:hypothetical protein
MYTVGTLNIDNSNVTDSIQSGHYRSLFVKSYKNCLYLLNIGTRPFRSKQAQQEWSQSLELRKQEDCEALNICYLQQNPGNLLLGRESRIIASSTCGLNGPVRIPKVNVYQSTFTIDTFVLGAILLSVFRR